MKKALIISGLVVPVLISALLAGAHFYRAGNIPLTALSLALPLVLIVPHPYAARAVQVGLLLAGTEWIRTAYLLASIRVSLGLPWARLTIIIGSVALFTIATILVFYSKTFRDRYGQDDDKNDINAMHNM